MSEIPRYVAYLIWYPCVIVQLLLFAFADTPKKHITRKASRSPLGLSSSPSI